MTPEEKSLIRAKAFATNLMSEAKLQNLTLFEMSMALQAIENTSHEEHREAWEISWNLAQRVWTRAKELSGG
jgi:hypothetical protein